MEKKLRTPVRAPGRIMTAMICLALTKKEGISPQHIYHIIGKETCKCTVFPNFGMEIYGISHLEKAAAGDYHKDTTKE